MMTVSLMTTVSRLTIVFLTTTGSGELGVWSWKLSVGASDAGCKNVVLGVWGVEVRLGIWDEGVEASGSNLSDGVPDLTIGRDVS